MPGPNTPVQADQGDDLLWRHLKSVPAFRGLLRAVEARYYHHLDIQEPVLDLGCGDGHFASMAFDHSLMAGVDPWWGPLKKALRTGRYLLNVQALGDALPFPDNAFASVISNSVLEHIPDVQPVLDEAARVLRPGGKIIITMPSHLFTENLGGATALRPLGLADAYRRLFNRISRHAHTDPPQVWAQRLALAGFSIERWQYYFSEDALRALELGHLQGLPSAILHFLTGHWIIAPWHESLAPTERWLRPFYEEEAPSEGAYLIMVARKAPQVTRSDGSIEVRLPAAQPLPIHEPQAEADASTAQDNVPGESRPTLSPQPDSVYTLSPGQEEIPRSADGPAPASDNRALPVLLLLLAGLFAAFSGQGILSRRLPTSLEGLWWYAFALLAFASAAWLLQRGQPALRYFALLSKRHLLYPLALVLSLFAQEQSGGSLSGGSPILAFALWFLGIACAIVALSPQTDEQRSSQQTAPGTDLDAQQENKRGTYLAWIRRRSTPLRVVGLFFVALIPRITLLADHPFIVNGIEASLGLDALDVLAGQIRNPFATAWLSNPTLPLFPLAPFMALVGRSPLGLRLLSALVGALTVPILYLIARRLWNAHFALAASLLLAGYHLHLHYSRLGMSNFWDPFVALLIFGLIAIAAEHPNRRNWLWAGLATGLGTYFYTPSHLLPIYLAVILGYLVLAHRDTVVSNWSNLIAAGAIAFVVSLPQVLYYRANPGLFLERVNALGILQNDWLAQQVIGGQSAATALGLQLQRAFLAFNASLDTSTSYNPGIPLLRFWPALFFVVGAALAVWRIKQPRYALLLIWTSVTLVFAGALLVDAPDSHRLLIAAPAVILLTTSGLYWLARQFGKIASSMSTAPGAAAPERRVGQRWKWVIIIVVLFFVAGDLLFYFGDYRLAHRFGDRNSEVAFEVGRYLDALEGDWQAYFHGPPAMYVNFPTILFLSSEFEPDQNLFDVPAASQSTPEVPPGVNLTFIYLPERSGEVNRTSERYPQGSFRTVDGILANPLFYVYEVRR